MRESFSPIRMRISLAMGEMTPHGTVLSGMSFTAHHHQLIDRRGSAPHLAGSAVELTNARSRISEGNGVKYVRRGIKTDQRIAAEIGEPHIVLVIDIDRIGLR